MAATVFSILTVLLFPVTLPGYLDWLGKALSGARWACREQRKNRARRPPSRCYVRTGTTAANKTLMFGVDGGN